MNQKEDGRGRAVRLYDTFTTTGQESRRLQSALEGYFLEESDAKAREEYASYLKRRIRPAVEALMQKEEVAKIEILEKKGYIEQVQLDGFIQLARSQGRMASLIWLLHLKQEKYGFKDRDFTL